MRCHEKKPFRRMIFPTLISLGVGLVVQAPLLAWGGTVLGDLAAKMPPGTWAELNTSGFSGAFLETAPGAPITIYADSAAWDPNSRRFLYLGAPHMQPWKFILYDDLTNMWSSGPLPESCMAIPAGCIGHGYDHNAINQAAGDFYHRPYNSRNVYQYKGGAWSPLPAISSSVMPVVGITGGLQYFPELGGLVYIQGADGGVYFLKTGTSQWSSLAQNLAMGPYHNFIEYNPVHKVMIFGGGNNRTDIYKLDATGTITKMKNAPSGYYIGINSTIVAVDPVSGKFLIFGPDGSFYAYDIITDTWQLQGGTRPQLVIPDTNRSAIVSPISTYGVVMFVTYDGPNSKVYLYKHSPMGPPDTTSPAAPTGLQAR